MRRTDRFRGAVGPALLLTAALVLAGCSDETSPGDPRDSESIETEPVVPSGAAPQPQSSGQDEAPSEAAGAGSVEGTGAAVAPSFPAVTRDDVLDGLWELANLDGERPDVDLIREVADDEWLSVHVECMTEVGFPPTSNNDQGGVRWDVTAGQADAFDLATFTCSAQYPRLLAYSQPYTSEQLTMMYDWMIEETVPCLAAEGYEVTDVVSLGAFMASYSPQGGFWTPDDGVPGGAPFSAQEACPHMPPQEVLFGQ